MTTEPTAAPKPKRRWLQFSLRTLLVLMLAFGCGFGWLAMKVKQAREQEAAVRAIQELGGLVLYDNSLKRTGPAPAWLQKLLGDDFFRSVTAVHGSHFSDGGLVHVVAFSRLETLDLAGLPDEPGWRGGFLGGPLPRGPSNIQREGLPYLHGLANRSPSEVTDAGLVQLRRLSQLRWLSLDNTQVTDAGLGQLKEFPQLNYLGLSNTQVSDAGLVHLQTHTQLASLALGNTQITDAGMERILRLTQLQSLVLGKTQLTDAGLEHLKELTQLKHLELFNTKVTDTGLVHLQPMKHLEGLLLFNTYVTDAGVDELKNALPRLIVYR